MFLQEAINNEQHKFVVKRKRWITEAVCFREIDTLLECIVTWLDLYAG